MKTIGTIALALVTIGFVTSSAEAGKKKSKKKAHATKVAPAEAPRRLTDSMGVSAIKLATPTGAAPRKLIVIEDGALAAAGESFDLGGTARLADMPSGEAAMRLEGVRLTTADAGEVVKGNWDDIDYCWSRVPAAQRDALETSLVFTVDPRGKVLSVSVDGSSPGKFATCMKVAAKRWNFPIADGESVVEYPLSLH